MYVRGGKISRARWPIEARSVYMGTDAATLGKKGAHGEAEKMNSCASRAHTSNFHFAQGSGSSQSAAPLPRSAAVAIPRDMSDRCNPTDSEPPPTSEPPRLRARLAALSLCQSPVDNRLSFFNVNDHPLLAD